MVRSTTLADHQTVRDASPVLQDTVYLNVGTYGVTPQPALAHLLEVLGEFEQRGVASTGGLGQEAREARGKVAGVLKVRTTSVR